MFQKILAILKDRSKGGLRILAILSLSWAAALFLGFFITDLGAPSLTWLAALGLRIVVIGAIFISLRLYPLGDTVKGYRVYKAFVGYGTVFSYVAAALHSTAAFEAGVYPAARAWLGWAVAVLETAPSLALYFWLCTDKARLALGVLSPKDIKAKLKWKPAKPKTIGGKVADNADAVFQAIIMVAIVHSTLFQLYVIPSESMVPKFLIGNRVIVTKVQAGPRVPLSPLKIPVIDRPERGNIIVYDNPFSQKPPVLNRMANTLVFYLTLASVNLDKENGTDRVGTVVKRLVGLPGEKLLMVDDILYARTAQSDWAPLAADQAWANYDLWKLDSATRSKIRQQPIDKAMRAELSAIDQWKAGADKAALIQELAASAARLGSNDPDRLRASLKAEALRYLLQAEKSVFPEIERIEAAEEGKLYRESACAQETMGSDVPLFLYAVSSRQRQERFFNYLNAPDYLDPLDPYQESAAKLNLGIKANQADRWAFYLSLLKSGDITTLSRLAALEGTGLSEGRELAQVSPALARWVQFLRYMQYYDARNFPAFPSGEGYIPAGKYFLMGDNRYNSLDFRFFHTNQRRTIDLDGTDPQSVTLVSTLDPSLLDKDRILGKVLFTFWPPSAIGR